MFQSSFELDGEARQFTRARARVPLSEYENMTGVIPGSSDVLTSLAPAGEVEPTVGEGLLLQVEEDFERGGADLDSALGGSLNSNSWNKIDDKEAAVVTEKTVQLSASMEVCTFCWRTILINFTSVN